MRQRPYAKQSELLDLYDICKFVHRSQFVLFKVKAATFNLKNIALKTTKCATSFNSANDRQKNIHELNYVNKHNFLKWAHHLNTVTLYYINFKYECIYKTVN